MDQAIKEISLEEKSMDVENLNGKIAATMMADGFIRCIKERVLLPGVMEEYTKESGRATWCMEMVHIHGQMVENTKDNIIVT